MSVSGSRSRRRIGSSRRRGSHRTPGALGPTRIRAWRPTDLDAHGRAGSGRDRRGPDGGSRRSRRPDGTLVSSASDGRLVASWPAHRGAVGRRSPRGRRRPRHPPRSPSAISPDRRVRCGVLVELDAGAGALGGTVGPRRWHAPRLVRGDAIVWRRRDLGPVQSRRGLTRDVTPGSRPVRPAPLGGWYGARGGHATAG